MLDRDNFKAVIQEYATRQGLHIADMSIRIMYQRYLCGTTCEHVRAALATINEVAIE